MALEQECKFRVDDHEPVRRALAAAGGSHQGTFDESNHILDRPDGDLWRQGCGLRLRTWSAVQGAAPAPQLTFKGKVLRSPVKSREEIEINVSDGPSALALLHALGFVEHLRYRKRRERWTVGRCHVELDTVPLLGRFVEIEGPDAPTILALATKLGLSEAQVETETYVYLLLRLCKERGLDPTHLDDAGGATL